MSELPLSRSDLTQVSPIAGRHTARVLPLGKHKTQRVVVGDSDGQLLCFAMKRGAAKAQWRIAATDWRSGGGSPSARRGAGGGGGKSSGGGGSGNGRSGSTLGTGAGKHPILTMTVAGDKGDKIFISQKSGIKGISKKGSVFYEFAPNLADPISSFDVAGTHLHAAAQYSYTLFQDSRELHHRMCPGEVNSLLLGPSVRRGATTPQTALLGCSDRMIRVVQGGQFTHTIQVDGAAKSLAKDGPAAREIFYGLNTGTIGVVRGSWSGGAGGGGGGAAEGKGGAGEETSTGNSGSSTPAESEDAAFLRRGWVLHSAGPTAGVNCLASWDPLGDGVDNLVVGRDDGSVQVFGFGFGGASGGASAFDRVGGLGGTGSSSLAAAAAPSLRFEHNLGESVRSIDIGKVSAPQFDEVVAATFTGRICR